MPKPFPVEFRRDVIAVARRGDASLAQAAHDFGVSPSCLQRWLKAADRQDGTSASAGNDGAPSDAELVALRRRNELLEQGNEVLRRATVHLTRDVLPQRCSPASGRCPHRWSQTWPSTRSPSRWPAGFSEQACCAWRAAPVSDRD